jgi:hypothetical protein
MKRLSSQQRFSDFAQRGVSSPARTQSRASRRGRFDTVLGKFAEMISLSLFSVFHTNPSALVVHFDRAERSLDFHNARIGE